MLPRFPRSRGGADTSLVLSFQSRWPQVESRESTGPAPGDRAEPPAQSCALGGGAWVPAAWALLPVAELPCPLAPKVSIWKWGRWPQPGQWGGWNQNTAGGCCTVRGTLGLRPGSTPTEVAQRRRAFLSPKLCLRRACPRHVPSGPAAGRGTRATHSSTVKHSRRRWRPSARCFSRASRPRKGTADLSLQVKAKPASRGLSSERRSACQCR